MIDDYYDYIVPTFLEVYGIDLIDDDIPFPKFLVYLSGLTRGALIKIIELRTETNKEILKNYSKSQKKMWEEWQERKYEEKEENKKKYTYEDYARAYGRFSRITGY